MSTELLAIARDSSARDITSMPWLPQLPEEWAVAIYNEIEAEERRLLRSNMGEADYKMGTATIPDDIELISGDSKGQFLFTAEHATQPVRLASGKREMADCGTAGLASVLAQEHGRALIMIGDQTSNVSVDPYHPMKPKILPYLPNLDGFVSVHGMAAGKFLAPTDRTEIQGIIGLGFAPTEAQIEGADRVLAVAKEIGLHVIVGNSSPDYYIQKPHSHELKLDEHGQPQRGQLKAIKPTTSTNFVRENLQQLGKDRPVFQIELTRFLRWIPAQDDERDQVSRVMGVALGYTLLHKSIEAMKAEL